MERVVRVVFIEDRRDLYKIKTYIIVRVDRLSREVVD
jgi:hypothetical protein